MMSKVVQINDEGVVNREFRVTLDTGEVVLVVGAVALLTRDSETVRFRLVQDGAFLVGKDPESLVAPNHLYIFGRLEDGRYHYLTDIIPEADDIELIYSVTTACRAVRDRASQEGVLRFKF